MMRYKTFTQKQNTLLQWKLVLASGGRRRDMIKNIIINPRQKTTGEDDAHGGVKCRHSIWGNNGED